MFLFWKNSYLVLIYNKGVQTMAHIKDSCDSNFIIRYKTFLIKEFFFLNMKLWIYVFEEV